MNKTTIKKNRLIILSLCFIHLFTACVNKIDSETPLGTVPITFTTKVSKTNTRVTNTAFEKGDKVGLYAMLSSTSIAKERYINNLLLECGEDAKLIPEKTVFYPVGDAMLDFISYSPYQSAEIAANSSIIPVSVQSDQSNAQKRSLSDFLIATQAKIASSEKAVELKFHHKLVKFNITLTPKGDENVEALLKANPRIIATGFYNKADYDLSTEEFTIHKEEDVDIIPYGTWSIKEGKLIGKEIIIIPQEINPDTQSFVMDWNGQLYTCPMPELTMTGSTQCNLDIAAMQTTSHVLTGIASSIEDWTTVEGKETDNSGQTTAIHIAALSFTQSNVYRVYNSGKPIVEICKEYLKSDDIDSQAITIYPIGVDEQSDLNNGTVLQLLDDDRDINGGQISWNTENNSFTYTQGSSGTIDKFYLDETGKVTLAKPDKSSDVNVIRYTIRDIRNGALKEHPIIKIGTQYWMRKDLCETTYRTGTPLTKRVELGTGAGYFKPDKFEIYFYNGEAILAGDLAPEGWKIPNPKDWEGLKNYTGNEASLIKAGEWQGLKEDDHVYPASNLTGFGAYPVGMWYKQAHAQVYKMTGYWTLEDNGKTIPEQTIFLTGSDEHFISNGTLVTDKTFYKALSIRCIKE